ncbi:MAG: beta-ketoacyl synthase N-terminal-like domain-containing protein [Pirellulales bacterium]
MSNKRVVITGLGVVSPIGCDLDTIWSNLTNGKSGITPIAHMPTNALPVKSGAECKSFTGDIEDYGQLDKQTQRAIKKNMKVMCREIEMGVAAAQKALQHSGLGETRDPERCGCLFGCDYILSRPEEYADGMYNCQQPGNATTQDVAGWAAAWPFHGLNKVNPLWLLKYLPNMPNSHVSIYNDFRGPNNALTVREASMHLSVAEAASIIDRGAADVMLVGSTGSRIQPVRATHACLIDRLASEQSDPTMMSRPFDASCDGMVLGEGAAAIMLESLEHAQARGAKIWGEVVGSGSAMSGPHAGRDFMQQSTFNALRVCVQRATERLGKQWHLHAQGLSDPQVDQSEAAAISKLFDQLGYQGPVTAAKSYFGNLGAGGAGVELICSLLALDRGSLFPILNLKQPMSAAKWPAATIGTNPGKGFVHCSCTMQGQSASIAIVAA